MSSLVIGGKEFVKLNKDQKKLQEKIDLFIFTLKMMGYEIRYSCNYTMNFYSKSITMTITGSNYNANVTMTTYGYHIDIVIFQIYDAPFSVIKQYFKYNRQEHKSDYLNDLFDKFLIYM